MSGPRPLLLALALAGGCIEFEHPSTTDASEVPGSTGLPTTPSVGCDPLSQDCPEGQACALLDPDFACIEVATWGLAGDACAAPSECGPGLACCPGLYLVGCDAGACCTSLCDVGDAGAECLGAGETCVALYSGPDVPPAYLSYGVCKLDE